MKTLLISLLLLITSISNSQCYYKQNNSETIILADSKYSPEKEGWTLYCHDSLGYDKPVNVNNNEQSLESRVRKLEYELATQKALLEYYSTIFIDIETFIKLQTQIQAYEKHQLSKYLNKQK